jgi:glyoxylase-like metal-dependent hydrolase (beta-lactamase superfamily II)
MTLHVETLPVGPLQANCYLLADAATGRAVLVDPGDEGEALAARVVERGLDLDAIWVTHAHLDHAGGIAAVKRAFPAAPIWLHEADQPLYARVAQQGASWGIALEQPPATDRAWGEGDVVALGAHRFTVVHLPGHAPGHVALVGDTIAFVGDVVFAGSIGRTDLPLCDPRAMDASLKRVAQWPAQLLLHPGHGPTTTVERELRSNPFLMGLARPVGA